MYAGLLSAYTACSILLGRGLAGHKHYQGPEEGEYGEIALPAGYALHVINAAGAEEGICDIGCGGVDIVAYEGGIGAAGLGGLEGIKQQLCAAAPGNAYEHIVHSKAGGQHIHHHGIGYRCGVVAHVVELVGNIKRKKRKMFLIGMPYVPLMAERKRHMTI